MEKLLRIMLKALLGKKSKMDRAFDSHGRAVPVTKIVVEPNYLVGLRSKETDGYKAAQIGSGEKKHLTKALAGHFKKAGIEKNLSRLAEVAFEGDLSLGQEIHLEEVFRKGSLVDVTGTSKGKGFAGGVKRHGFHGGPKTHGQSDRHRAPGSIGSGTTPGRVFKGTKMAGHMGHERVTVQGLQILEVDKDNNLLLVKGSVPGPVGSQLIIKKSIKKPKAYHEPEIPAVPNLGGEKESEENKEEVSPGQEVKTPEVTTETSPVSEENNAN